MRPAAAFLVLAFLLFPGLCHGRPETRCAYTHNDCEFIIVLQKPQKLAIYDFREDRWSVHDTRKYVNKMSDRKLDLIELEGDRLALFHITDNDKITIDWFSKKNGKFTGQAEIKASDVGHNKLGYLRFRGITKIQDRVFILTSPLAKKSFRAIKNGLDITFIGRPDLEIKGIRGRWNPFRMPSHCDAFYFGDGFAISWAGIGKSNIGFIYRFDDNDWKILPRVPHPKDLPPFGGLTPRGGFGHCFSGDHLFIYGGSLTWSSNIDFRRDLGGMRYSIKDRTWKTLPKKGSPGYLNRPSLCWTGKEMFITLKDKCFLFDPVKWTWRTIESKVALWTNRRITLHVKGKTYVFGIKDRADKETEVFVDEYILAKGKWRKRKGLQVLR